jgi:hypothetical protein
MITAEEREAAFRKDWDKLLTKHGAVDNFDDVRGACVVMFTHWDNETDKNVTKEFCEFYL